MIQQQTFVLAFGSWSGFVCILVLVCVNVTVCEFPLLNPWSSRHLEIHRGRLLTDVTVQCAVLKWKWPSLISFTKETALFIQEGLTRPRQPQLDWTWATLTNPSWLIDHPWSFYQLHQWLNHLCKCPCNHGANTGLLLPELQLESHVHAFMHKQPGHFILHTLLWGTLQQLCYVCGWMEAENVANKVFGLVWEADMLQFGSEYHFQKLKHHRVSMLNFPFTPS